jgi:hypothetical protein
MPTIRTISKEGTQTGGGDRIFSQELVAAFVDHLPLMLIGPAVIALLVYLALWFQPGTYVSTSILRLDRPAAKAMQAVITSPTVAERVLSKYQGSATNREARGAFISMTLIDTDPSDRPGERIYRMEVTHENARSAQSISSDLINAWLETTVPGATERKTLEAELERLKSSITADSKLIEQLRSEAKTLLSPNSIAGELATPISALAAKRDQNLAAIAAIENKLAGTSRDVIILPANLPQTAVYPGKRGMALLAGFAAIPLLFALVMLGRYFAPGRSPREVMSGWFRRDS